eukprot:357862-Chlamydomonas_euryale.AAC.6
MVRQRCACTSLRWRGMRGCREACADVARHAQMLRGMRRCNAGVASGRPRQHVLALATGPLPFHDA